MIGFFAGVVTRSLFRSVRVDGVDPAAFRGPTLLVASHFGGFADPVMLLSVLPSTPRYLAKSTLWDAFWLAPLLNAVHAIPIYRAQDGGTEANLGTFEAAAEAMRTGETVAIFPEGFANDAPGLQPVKTGAARLAIDAHAAGVRGARIVPIVTQYEDKTRMRTRVWLRQGEPIDIDSAIAQVATAGRLAEGEAVTSEDREAVRAVTEMISMNLRAIGPFYEDEEAARRFRLAGWVAAERTGVRAEDAWVLATSMATRMAHEPDGVTAAVRKASAEYEDWLAQADLDEPAVSAATSGAGLGGGVVGLILAAAAALILLPLAAAGWVFNALAWGIVAGGRALRDAPVKEVTINVFVAPVIFPLIWLIGGVITWLAWSVWAGVIVTLAGPLGLAVMLGWWRLVQRIGLGLRARRCAGVIARLGADALEVRDRLRAEADALLASKD